MSFNARPLIIVAGKDPIDEIGGGHSHYVRAHARAAVELGLEPHLFCASPLSGTVETEYGVVHRINSPFRHVLHARPGVGYRSPTAVFHISSLASALVDFMKANHSCRLIHGISVWTAAALKARQTLRAAGHDVRTLVSAYTLLGHEHKGKLKGIGHEHGRKHRLRARAESIWIDRVLAPLEDRAYLEADLVLVNYESVRVMFAERYGARATVRVMPYTAESAFLQQEEATEPPSLPATAGSSTGPLIVAISRHDPRKGVNVLLRALARLRARNTPFRACLVGSGQLLHEHRRLASQLHLDDQVILTGFVDDPRAYLQQADIFVLPSLEEGSGSISLVEALQARLPVVASDLDGIPEDVAHDESALLVPPGDIDALADALEQLLSQPALRARLAAGAGDAFERRFSKQRFVEALGEVYREFGVWG